MWEAGFEFFHLQARKLISGCIRYSLNMFGMEMNVAMKESLNASSIALGEGPLMYFCLSHAQLPYCQNAAQQYSFLEDVPITPMQ